MSWQDVDSNLLSTGKLVRAAILGQQGGVWATSAGYNITPEEQAAIVKSFDDPSQAQASGIRANGSKFFTLSANERSIYGKKGGDGIVMVKTKQAVLVAEYTQPTQPGEATKIVEMSFFFILCFVLIDPDASVYDLADYLLSVQF